MTQSVPAEIVILELTIIVDPICVAVATFALFLVSQPLAIVAVAIIVSHATLSVPCVFLPVSFIDAVLFVSTID